MKWSIECLMTNTAWFIKLLLEFSLLSLLVDEVADETNENKHNEYDEENKPSTHSIWAAVWGRIGLGARWYVRILGINP